MSWTTAFFFRGGKFSSKQDEGKSVLLVFAQLHSAGIRFDNISDSTSAKYKKGMTSRLALNDRDSSPEPSQRCSLLLPMPSPFCFVGINEKSNYQCLRFNDLESNLKKYFASILLSPLRAICASYFFGCCKTAKCAVIRKTKDVLQTLDKQAFRESHCLPEFLCPE